MRFSSRRPLPCPTTRKAQVRLSVSHTSVVGAKEPVANRLYELMLGAKKYVSSRVWRSWPAMKCLKVSLMPSPSDPGKRLPLPSQKLQWMWQEFPSRSSHLAMNEIELPCCQAISLAPFL